jgi:hypothetical protein
MLHALAERERRKKQKDERAFESDEEMRAKVTLTQGEMDAWNQIAAGRPMRNSTAVLQAIKMKMEYTVQKPAQKVDADTKVQIEIVNLGEPAIPPAPPYQPGQIDPDDVVKSSPRPEKEDPDA